MKIQCLGSGSKGNCYILTTDNGNENLIIEAGVNDKDVLKACNFKLKNIAGCIITHEHGDHSKYAKNLSSYGVKLYGTVGTKEALCIDKMIPISEYKLTEGKYFECGNFRIMQFPVVHDAIEPCAYWIYHEEMGQLLFVTDTSYLNCKLQGLSTMMIECNYVDELLDEAVNDGTTNPGLAERIRNKHLSLDNCVEILDGYKNTDTINQVILLHCSARHGDMKQSIEKCTLALRAPVYFAKKGMNINII